jgi:hypothetical protein
MFNWTAPLPLRVPSVTTVANLDTFPRTVVREDVLLLLRLELLQHQNSPKTEPLVTSVEVPTTLLATAKLARSSATPVVRRDTFPRTAMLEETLEPRPATTAARLATFLVTVRRLSS